MSANVEFFVKVDEIKSVTEQVLQFDKMGGNHYYDKDGNHIEVYFKRDWKVSDHIICANGKEISLRKLKEIFGSRYSLNMEFSFTSGSDLVVSCYAEDSVQLQVMIDVLSEFLYDVFDKELEF